MKVYYLNYTQSGSGEGIIEAFKSNTKANQRRAEINRQGEAQDKIEEIGSKEFPITAQGIIDAIEWGAKIVWK